jgi:hypothetical protein
MPELANIPSRSSVKKGYEVVMARGQNDLDLADLKMFNFLLQRSYNKLNERTIHEIAVSDVLSFLKHTSVARLEQSLKKLGNVKIDIDYQEDGVDHSVSCHFLSYDVSKTENGMLSYAFDSILLRFLWEPKIYARINMKFFSQFRTSYGAKLYEIMAFYQHRHHRTWAVSIETLRHSLGVSEGQYDRFDNLKKAVIEKAVNEVNALATFGVNVEYIRGGRGGKVVEVRFSIVPRSELAPIPSDVSPSAKKAVRDPDTVDLLDGQTDSERGSNLIISSQAMEEAREILLSNDSNPDDLEDLVEQWRSSVVATQVTDANLNFLRWLSLTLNRRSDDNLGLVEEDVITTLLAGFE